MPQETITIQVELTTAEASAFAQFLKRITHSGYREYCAGDHQQKTVEAYHMRDAGEAIADALAEKGFSPR